MNNDGVYWMVQKDYKFFDSMKQKILYELKKLKKDKFSYDLRMTYIKKFYKRIKFNEII